MPYKPSNGHAAALINAQVQAENDSRPCIARCAFCPDFAYEGTAAECRDAWASHRRQYHRDTKVPTRRRRHVSRFNLGLESDRLAGEANAASVARMLASRQVA